MGEQGGPRPRGPWLVGTALVVVLLVGAGLVLFLGDPVTLGGRYVTDPGAVLADADRALARYVEDRNGVSAEDSRCWFELTERNGHAVRDSLACGPVLFVDGHPDRAWLHFALIESADGGDVRLRVAPQPTEPDPVARPDATLLRRPDGLRPPEGSAGLAVPAPARAAAGWSTSGPFPELSYEPPAVPARLTGPAVSVTVTGLAQPDRVGTGDAARRPAEGERFLAVRYAIESGEGLSSAPPAMSYQVDGADPVPVAPALVAPGSTVEAIISVPRQAASADLVVDDAGVQQRLSLLTGAPGAGNLQVLVRTHRRIEPPAPQQLVGTLSMPGRSSVASPFTVTVNGGTLQWSSGPDGDKRPSGPDRALLVLDASMAVPGQAPGAVPVEYLSLTLPDGTVLPALDLDDAPDRVLPAFDVPAGFTDGVLGFGGAATFPDTAVADFGPGRLEFPLTVPAG